MIDFIRYIYLCIDFKLSIKLRYLFSKPMKTLKVF